LIALIHGFQFISRFRLTEMNQFFQAL
jgi:hypothetical protein